MQFACLHHGGQVYPATQGLGQQQAISGPSAALVPELLRVPQTIHRKARSHLRPFNGVAAHQGAAGGVQFLHRTCHQALQIPSLQFRVVPGQGHVGQRRVGCGVHGIQIAQAV